MRPIPTHARTDVHRLAMIRADLQRRIRRVSAAMPADEFEDLIEQMAQVQLTFERRNRDA